MKIKKVVSEKNRVAINAITGEKKIFNAITGAKKIFTALAASQRGLAKGYLRKKLRDM